MPRVEEIMTLKEVAIYLKVKNRTIYKWVRERTIPAHKLGGTWRFRRPEIDKWLQVNTNLRG